MTETRPTSVVVADNNEFYRQVLGDFYREQGFEVRVAADGMETLAMVRERRPDLLVLDLIMPRFDGARLCAFLKSQSAYAGIPIIILSGILADEIDGVEEIRADAYIAKMPLDQIRSMLHDATRELLSGRSGASPILSGFEKMYRREVVLELLQERRTAQITLDSLSEGIVELSHDRSILIANRAFQDLTGAPASDLLAKPLEDVFPASRPILRSMFDEVERGRPRADASIRLGDRELQLKLHRLDTDALPGAPGVSSAVRRAATTTSKVRLESMISAAGYTLLVEDITQRVKAERERELLRSRLAQSEKMSAIGLFVAGAAHELNNPLTSVLGYSQLLMQKHPGGEMARDLGKVAEGAARCKTILENLMAFARANRPAKAPVDFNALLLESLSGYADRLRDAGIETRLDLSPDLPGTLADPLQILQAFRCIVDNIWKALSGHPGRRLAAVSSRAAGGKILIEFSDSGPGIPEAVLGKVFEPFFTTRQVGQGAGLGLSAAYGMVTAHAGRIQAKNRPEGGATVTLEFPVIAREEGAAERRAVGPPPAATGAPDERRILIVDDETVVQELLVDMLDTPRNRIETASSGRDGLRRMQETDFDVVILDLRMPDMTGLQVYDELTRQRPEMLGRLLFITADTVTPEIEEFLDRAGNPCISKPFALDTVLRQVEGILAAAGR